MSAARPTPVVGRGSAGDDALAADGWTQAVVFALFVVAPALSLVAFRIFDSALVACAAMALVPMMRHRHPDAVRPPNMSLAPLALLLAWSAVTFLWSPRYGIDLYRVSALAAIIASAVILSRLLGRSLDDRRIALIGAMVVGISLLSAVDLWTGGGFRLLFGQPVGAFETYPALHQQLLTAIPIAVVLLQHDRTSLALAVIGACALAVFSSSSDSAKIGLLMSVPIAVAAWWLPRLSFVVAGFAGVLVLVATPWLIDGLLDGATRLADTLLPGSHALEREAIYRSAAHLARDASPFGHGIGSTRVPAEVWSVAAIPDGLRGLFDHAFPHNLALQIWLELGIVGVVLAVATWIAALLWMFRQPAPQRVAGLVIVGISLVIAQINHSLWQGWWIACVAFGLAILSASASLRR